MNSLHKLRAACETTMRSVAVFTRDVGNGLLEVSHNGLALLGCGKRDISHDLEMPIPIGLARRGALESVAAPPDWRISALNDQHAYLRFPPGAHASALPRIGDRVELGISHPCTTFDKWRWMPIVEDDGRVSGAIQTFF